MAHQINGIQQMGVGVPNVLEGWEWYNKNFGMDVKVFDEAAVAKLMLPHTGGQTRERRAIFALNMQGGGGFEIWQHTGKVPEMPKFEIQIGDLGVCIAKMKTTDIHKAYNTFSSKGLELLTSIEKDPAGTEHFYMKDLYGNLWEFVQESSIFTSTKAVNGGVFGGVVGVKNIEESLPVYRDILGYDKVVYDQEDVFADWGGVPGSGNRYRRMLLAQTSEGHGAFSPVFGKSQIELVQALDREPKGIFDGRIWGDPGYIQICYDIANMDDLREFVKSKGFPFTVDSTRAGDTFDMGEAAGSFAYIQAPEGTLIEFVETHKVPIVKKLGLVIDLHKRGMDKPLPRWLLKMFSLKRVKM
ncbi:MAG: VOC family protein [Salinivirgaceae bacterium]|nr:VOC family protein [Salinivirgaceae bacterium]